MTTPGNGISGYEPVKLNLGCGDSIIRGWVNVDYAVGARFAKIPLFGWVNRRLKLFDISWDRNIVLHDLSKPFPWRTGSVDVIYSSHFLEHLSREEGRFFLRESSRVLRSEGIIRIVVPDLAFFVGEYLGQRISADDFLLRLDVLYTQGNNRLKNKLAPFIQFPHRCMYDSAALLTACREVGFVVQLRNPMESDIVDISVIEQSGRTDHAVVVEGRKEAVIRTNSGNHPL